MSDMEPLMLVAMRLWRKGNGETSGETTGEARAEKMSEVEGEEKKREALFVGELVLHGEGYEAPLSLSCGKLTCRQAQVRAGPLGVGQRAVPPL